MFSISVLACSLVAGAVDDTPERVNFAIGIFGIGILLLIVHAGVFIFRSLKKKRKSGWVFWTAFTLSVFIVPIVFFMLLMSAGTACGFGASNAPIFLLAFELIGIAAQIIAGRIVKQPVSSPVPLD